MKNLSLLITLLAILLVSCAPGPTPVPVSTATDVPLPTSTFTPEPTDTPTATPTRTPRPTATPMPINEANFVPPVGLDVPQYHAFDLNPSEGVIKSNAGSQYNGITYRCNGLYFIPGTRDNHFAYDYGTGNCSKHLVGIQINGMSVGFDGVVLSVGSVQQKYATTIDYGHIRCTDGVTRHIVIQYAHSIPLVQVGDKVNSNTPIAELEQNDVEIEIMVIGNGKPIDPRLIGLEPRCPSFCD